MEKTGRELSLKAYFEGNWSFERSIFDDRDQGPYGIANGIAHFTPTGKKRLTYNEKGKLSLTASGQEFTFMRSFIYVFYADQLEIFFNDGANSGKSYQRYSLDRTTGLLAASVGHSCRDDCYNGIFTIISPAEYKLETSIKGPKKELKIETYAKKVGG